MFTRLQFAAIAVVGVYSVAMSSVVNASPLVPRQLQTEVPNCARNYTVRLGDTCDIISDHLGVSTYQLATVNTGTINADCSNLALGEPLCLGIEGHDCTIVHVMVEGDTCDSILASAGITIHTLVANNPNVNAGCTNIYPGEVLCTATTLVYA